MLTDLLLPWLPGLRLEAISATDDTITLALSALHPQAPCPICAHPSTAIHSRYPRTVADLPWASVAVRLTLTVRRFFCRNRSCTRRIFAERLPNLVAPFARRTQRLQAEQRRLGLDLGGEAGSRTAQRQGMPTSPDTVLRLIRRVPLSPAPTPTVLGVDDWARRKGRTYGTLLVDLERHTPIDLLDERSAAVLECWLRAHPGITHISRDRANEYADGATRGAPAAVQIADRFHLLQNIRDMLQRVLERHHAALRAATVASSAADDSAVAATPRAADAAAPHDPGTPAASTVPASETAAPTTAPISRPQQRSAVRRAARLTRYTEVRALRARGRSLRAIARELGLGRRTVERFVRAEVFPERATRRQLPSKLDPFVPYLTQQLGLGQDNAVQLWREIRDAHGYGGSRALVSRWVAQHRHLVPPPAAGAPLHRPKRRGRGRIAPVQAPRTARRRLSARQASWLLVCRPDDLDEEDRPVVERLCAASADIERSYRLAQAFTRMVRERQAAALPAWLAEAATSGIPEVLSFVAGIRRDQPAVTAGLSLPFSNGQTEGQITRLKLIRRSMYGRGNFDLLRHRVLAR